MAAKTAAEVVEALKELETQFADSQLRALATRATIAEFIGEDPARALAVRIGLVKQTPEEQAALEQLLKLYGTF